jgi:hypothetical protein
MATAGLVGQMVKARRELATHQVGERVWLNDRWFRGAHPHYKHL